MDWGGGLFTAFMAAKDVGKNDSERGDGMAQGGEGLTWDEASPEMRQIAADNQAWAEANGYAEPGSPEHHALRIQEGAEEKPGWFGSKRKAQNPGGSQPGGPSGQSAGAWGGGRGFGR